MFSAAPGRPSIFVLSLALVACGGATSTARELDESEDVGGGGGPTHTAEIPQGLDQTQWRWVEASCTEGPLDLASRGYSSTLRIEEDGTSLDLTYDTAYVTDGCQQTIIQRVSPPESTGELRMEEIARVAVPATPNCFGQPEAPRPGEILRDGRRLSVLVQRSRWCGGFEVRMTYEPMTTTTLGDDEIVRRYAAHYSRGDADRVANLFAETGSVLEPFTVTASGDPYRHDGRQAVRQWLTESFEGTPWRALRITAIERADAQLVMRWEYMDPRLSEPLPGRNVFTVAGGEIFESQIQLDGTPTLAH
jgi:hypothetical protein